MNLKEKKEYKGVLYHYKELYKHVTYYNRMAPFPIYDTEFVEKLKDKIDMMEHATKEDYDKLPVYFCKHCKSLHIEIDEQMRDICNRCGSVNEIDQLPNIEDYNEKYGNIW